MVLFIGLGLLLVGISVPLILRKIPKNHFYGVRFPQSYKSDKHWYLINQRGGWALLICGVLTALYGLGGLFVRATSRSSLIGGHILLGLSLVVATAWSYIDARRIDKRLSRGD